MSGVGGVGPAVRVHPGGPGGQAASAGGGAPMIPDVAVTGASVTGASVIGASVVDDATWRPVVLPAAPPASSAAVRRVLQRNGRRDTAPELALRRELHGLGLRFLVDASPAGTTRRRRADVVLRGSRIAVLVHGCFWHRCPEHFHAPQANAQWWQLKFDSIVSRDADTERVLRAAGWLPVVVWEHEDVREAAARIRQLDTARRLPGGVQS